MPNSIIFDKLLELASEKKSWSIGIFYRPLLQKLKRISALVYVPCCTSENLKSYIINQSEPVLPKDNLKTFQVGYKKPARHIIN